MIKIKKVIGSALVLAAFLLGSVAMLTPVVSAAPATDVNPSDAISGGVKAAGGGSTSSDALPNLIQTIVNVLLFIAGAIAVIMIILGGIRYVTSNGDQAQVKAAKDTILYSVVGLIVALLAFAIVQFVVANIK